MVALLRRLLLPCLLALASLPSSAAFHLWIIDEVFSNADGTVQYIELRALAGGQQFLLTFNASITAGTGPSARTFPFPNDLPGDTTNKRMLIGTNSFAALGLVTPDYVVPDNFLDVPSGRVSFSGGDVWNYPAMPTDGSHSLSRDGGGTIIDRSPTNFAGQTIPQFTLTVAKAGAGSGSVSGPGIDCGLDCTETVDSGTAIALSAGAGAGSTFAGWSGAGCSGVAGCTVTVDADKTATATFTLNQYTVSASAGANGSISPASRQVDHGSTTTFTVTADSGYIAAISGTCPAGSLAGTTYTTGAITSACTVTATFAPVAPANPPRMINISTRMQVLTGDDVMIGGFVIGAGANKSVAIVATGPSLANFGIANPLANPMITLVRSSDQVVIATNDDWQGGCPQVGVCASPATLTAAGFAPSHPLEAAMYITLPPGAYTAIVQGVGGGTGTAVSAVYEVDAPTTPLANISTRGRVLTGDNVMIGGFVVTGSGPQTVAIVATGPSLAAFGIASPLANPTISLVRSSDQVAIDGNDDWQSHANAAQLLAAGFAPTHPQESGIYVTLQPGAYTVILSGVSGGTGVGIIGVYKVN